MKRIFEYTDYRAWIRAWKAEKPVQRTQNELGRRHGGGSGLVSMILSGQRNASVDEATRWGEAMRLHGEELAHWCAMVRFAHGSETESHEAGLELRARRAFHRAQKLPVERDAFASWHTWAVLELARCAGFRLDAEWVTTVLRPTIALAEAQDALDALVEAGLITVEDDGTAHARDVPVAMPDPSDPETLARLKGMHRDQLDYASTALDHSEDERLVVSIVFAAPRKALPALKDRLQHAILRAVEGLTDLGPPDQVFQVSLQLVPRSEGPPRDRT